MQHSISVQFPFNHFSVNISFAMSVVHCVSLGPTPHTFNSQHTAWPQHGISSSHLHPQHQGCHTHHAHPKAWSPHKHQQACCSCITNTSIWFPKHIFRQQVHRHLQQGLVEDKPITEVVGTVDLFGQLPTNYSIKGSSLSITHHRPAAHKKQFLKHRQCHQLVSCHTGLASQAILLTFIGRHLVPPLFPSFPHSHIPAMGFTHLFNRAGAQVSTSQVHIWAGQVQVQFHRFQGVLQLGQTWGGGLVGGTFTGRHGL